MSFKGGVNVPILEVNLAKKASTGVVRVGLPIDVTMKGAESTFRTILSLKAVVGYKFLLQENNAPGYVSRLMKDIPLMSGLDFSPSTNRNRTKDKVSHD